MIAMTFIFIIITLFSKVSFNINVNIDATELINLLIRILNGKK